MADAAFDTLAAARRLKDASVEPAQAEAIAETIGAAVGGGRLATKDDVHTVSDRVRRIEDRIESIEERMATKADMYRALWMQTGIIVAAVVALMKLLP